MSNPWLKKNPFMSMWLSSANRMAAPVRGQVAAQARRQVNAVADAAVAEGVKFWTEALMPVRARKARARSKVASKAARNAR
jgi:hypothetical protein